MKRLDPMPPKVLQLIMVAEDYFLVPVIDIIGNKRHKDIITARHACIYKLFQLSVEKKQKRVVNKSKIGRWFGRDHTSVIHSIQNVQNWLDTDELFVKKYKAFSKASDNIGIFDKKKILTLEERIMRLPDTEKKSIIAYVEKIEKQNEAKGL